MPVLNRPLNSTKFTLDVSGLAGFFGGEEAVSAMATVHLFEGREWLGWYNSPGGYTIGKRFGQIASSRFWDGLFPGPSETPAIWLGLDGKQGPKYVASLSGTETQTGHLGYLMMRKAKDEKGSKKIEGRETAPSNVAFLELKDVKYDEVIKVHKGNVCVLLLALVPILTSILCCVACALVADWYCSSMILLGMLSSGLACLVIGSGRVSIDVVKQPGDGTLPGDGMLMEDDTVVIVKGAEKDVNAIINGRFQVKTGREPSYDSVGLCSLLLLIHILLQLLLIPQGSLLGQILYLGTLGVSWFYNLYLSSLEKEKIQAKILFRNLGKPDMRKFRLGTRVTMIVFACLLMCDGLESPFTDINPGKILRDFIRNDTQVWERWRKKVIQQMMKGTDTSPDSLICLEINDDDRSNLRASEINLLTTLLKDAKSAFTGYHEHFVSS